MLDYKLSTDVSVPAGRVAFVGWAFQEMSHGSYPDFLPSFFPTRAFFPACFFSGLRSDSILCELSLSSVLLFSTTYLKVIEVGVLRTVISAVLGRNSQNIPNGFPDSCCTA